MSARPALTQALIASSARHRPSLRVLALLPERLVGHRSVLQQLHHTNAAPAIDGIHGAQRQSVPEALHPRSDSSMTRSLARRTHPLVFLVAADLIERSFERLILLER